MFFKVLKSGFDGLSGSGSSCRNIEEAIKEIGYFRGWNSLDDLHTAIRSWSRTVWPGSIFFTQVSAIVAVPPGDISDHCLHCGAEDLAHGRLTKPASYIVEQKMICHSCKKEWTDIFMHAERVEKDS